MPAFPFFDQPLLRAAAVVASFFLLASVPARAESPGQMLAMCRNQAHEDLKVRLPDIEAKYNGPRGDGTHAVSGTALHDGKKTTFKCSFDKAGKELTEFFFDDAMGVASDPEEAKAEEAKQETVAAPPRPQEQAAPEASSPKEQQTAKAENTQFSATGELPCARAKSQPMSKCKFGVVRHGNGEGSITIYWPDGGNRIVFFENDTPVRYDESQADGGASMRIVKPGDLFKIRIGEARFEVPEVVITGD